MNRLCFGFFLGFVLFGFFVIDPAPPNPNRSKVAQIFAMVACGGIAIMAFQDRK